MRDKAFSTFQAFGGSLNIDSGQSEFQDISEQLLKFQEIQDNAQAWN